MMGYKDTDSRNSIRLPALLFSKEAYEKHLKLQKNSPVVNMNVEDEGSADRFKYRLQIFKQKNKSLAKHHFWWFVHNCIAHVCIGIFPSKLTFKFHDWTSKRINGE